MAINPLQRVASVPALRPRDAVDLGVRTGAWLGVGLVLTFFLALAAFLVVQSLPALRADLVELLLGRHWHYPSGVFGSASMVFGTVAVTLIGIAIAAPLALGAAVTLSELLPRRLAVVLRTAVELLAGVPSVVYGLLCVLYLVPLVQDWFGAPSGDTLISGGLLLGVMILPTVASLSEGALRSVPAEAREAARALGLNRGETILHVVLRQARPGLVSALVLGIGRAAGETIAVFLVVGRADGRLPGSAAEFSSALLRAGQTLTSKLGSSEVNVAYGSEQHWGSLIALGLMLFIGVMTLHALGGIVRVVLERRDSVPRGGRDA